MTLNKYITAYYDDDDALLDGIKKLKEKGIKIADVLTPFPIHGIDHALGYRRSWISRVGFIGGAIGGTLAFIFQAWIFTVAYPLQIGGKPMMAVPSFIPVTFEMTVLFAAFAMVGAFLFRSNLAPGKMNFIHDERTTNDRFLIVVDANDKSDDEIETINAGLAEVGLQGITVKNS